MLAEGGRAPHNAGALRLQQCGVAIVCWSQLEYIPRRIDGEAMKTDIGHLPQTKQRELERVVRIIHEEFAGIVERSKSEAKKRRADL